MAAKSNVVIGEGQVTFKRTQGHNHDGLLSTLIDTKRYSIFDFTVAENGKDTERKNLQANNVRMLKTFIIDTIEGRVLKPTGIAIQANAITAREIVSGTITANELSSNIILVNNTIKSSNYINNTGTFTGWAIFSNGEANFNNVNIRGNLKTGNGVYAAANTPLYADNIGQFSLGSNFTWNGTTLTIRGTLQFPDGSTPGTFDNGDSITDGFIGGININSSEIQSTAFSPGSAGFRISANGNAEFNNVTVRGDLRFSDNSIPGTFDNGDALTDGFIGGININANEIQSTAFVADSAGFRISANGNAEFNNVKIRGTMDASTILGSSVTVGTFDGTNTGLQITSDGFIRGSGGGVKIKNWGTGTGTALFGDSIQTPTVIADKVSVSNGTNEFETDVNNVNYLTDITFTSTTADYAAVRILRSGTTAGSYHMSFGKTDGTNVGGIRYRANTNNTMAFIGDITGSSDIRLKENVQPLTNSLLIINQINPVKFNFISSPDSLEDGFIAQELFEIYPLAVEQGGDDPLTNPWSVMQPRLIPILTGAIKELSSKVDSLEARIQTLEGV